MSFANVFNEDYYENGIQKGIGLYENYRWMPTRSYEEAITIQEDVFYYLDIKASILDLGCAKGYLVHALRQLGLNAWGEDVSEYALENCHKSVHKYVSLPTLKHYDFIICKDVLEHIPEEHVLGFLKGINDRCTAALFVIPLGENERYRIADYEYDVTHLIRRDEDWWLDKIKEAGFELTSFTYKLGAIKKKWTKDYPYGNGFFQVSSK